jgi:hypothetical protein
VCVSSAALILSSAFSFADTCPPNDPVVPANEETLAAQYQPPDGNILKRFRFVPPTGGPKWPTVLMLPPDVFKLEYGDYGVPSERAATHDLQNAGFLVFQVDHRLAPPGALNGQLFSPTSGRFPQQTDLRNPGGLPDDDIRQFENDLDNYVGLPNQTDCAHDPDGKLNHASPAWLVTNGATSSPPVMLYATDGDPVPNIQATDMYDALRTKFGFTFEEYSYVMHYDYSSQTKHAFKYWHSANNADNSDGDCVSHQVILFLQAHP